MNHRIAQIFLMSSSENKLVQIDGNGSYGIICESHDDLVTKCTNVALYITSEIGNSLSTEQGLSLFAEFNAGIVDKLKYQELKNGKRIYY